MARRSTRRTGSGSAASPPWFALHGAPGTGERDARIASVLAWALAAVVAAVLLAVALGPHRIGDYSTETDFYGAYADGARMIQQGRLDPSRYGVVGPGYEVALALAGFLLRDLFLAAELLSVAATVATMLLWFRLLRRRSNARLALVAMLFLAANPHFFRFGYTASTDALALALQAGALGLLLATSGCARLVPASRDHRLRGRVPDPRLRLARLVPRAWRRVRLSAPSQPRLRGVRPLARHRLGRLSARPPVRVRHALGRDRPRPGRGGAPARDQRCHPPA